MTPQTASIENAEIQAAAPRNIEDFDLELGKACRIDNPDCESCQ